MKLYKATYDIKWSSGYWSSEYSINGPSSIYILAPDFKTATRLAETDEKINDAWKAAGSANGLLFKVELIASDVIQE